MASPLWPCLPLGDKPPLGNFRMFTGYSKIQSGANGDAESRGAETLS